MNYNARTVLGFCVTHFLSRSVWCESVLVVYVYLQNTHSTEQVGFVSGVMAVVAVLTSIVAGPVTEKTRRDTLLRSAGVVGVVALAFTVVALQSAGKIFLLLALALWGMSSGLSSPALETLFHNSMPSGERARGSALKHLACLSGTFVGLVVSAMVFLGTGNEWTLGQCRVVMYVGLGCAALPIALLFCFDDRKSAVEATEPLMDSQRASPLVCGLPAVPIAVGIADLLGALGAGASVQYFPIFLFEQLELSPSSVQLVYACAVVATVFCTRLSLALAHGMGRVGGTVVGRLVGAVLLLCMCILYDHDDRHLSTAPKLLFLAMFVARSAFTNSTRALTRSLMMDHVGKRDRSRWNALENANMFAWSVSAVVGGYFAHGNGILRNFYMTALLQGVGVGVLVLVLPLVGTERRASNGEGVRLMESPREHDVV